MPEFTVAVRLHGLSDAEQLQMADDIENGGHDLIVSATFSEPAPADWDCELRVRVKHDHLPSAIAYAGLVTRLGLKAAQGWPSRMALAATRDGR